MQNNPPAFFKTDGILITDFKRKALIGLDLPITA